MAGREKEPNFHIEGYQIRKEKTDPIFELGRAIVISAVLDYKTYLKTKRDKPAEIFKNGYPNIRKEGKTAEKFLESKRSNFLAQLPMDLNLKEIILTNFENGVYEGEVKDYGSIF